MNDLELLIDLHLHNDRQGPGGDRETRWAIQLAGLDGRREISVADIGCGTGAATLPLARHTHAHITAVDSAQPFVQQLRSRAEHHGLGDRVTPTVADMNELPFEDARFDAVWSEGAIYNIGFEHGVRSLRRILRPGGVIAVTEITWTTSVRPDDVHRHWTGEYPQIDTLPNKLIACERAGYRPIAAFFLPTECWTINYYEPLEAGFQAFLERHDDSAAARAIVEAERVEARLYAERGEHFGYAFYIAQRTA